MSFESTELSPYRRVPDSEPDGVVHLGDPLPDDEVHLRDYWRVLAKHRKLVIAVLIVSIASTAAYSFLKTPRYTSTATIQIERQAPKFAPVQGIEQTETAVIDKYDYYQTQYEILESRNIVARVIKGLGLDGDPRFVEEQEKGFLGSALDRVRSLLSSKADSAEIEEYGVSSEVISYYADWLAISPVRSSRLVKVSFTSETPELAAEIANRHVDEYVNASLDQRLEMTLRAKEFLETELAKAKARVDTAEVALNKFRKEKSIVSLDGSRSDIVSERLGDLNEEFTRAQAERIRLEAQYALVKRRDYESLPDVVSSSLISSLKQEASRVEVERAELGRRYRAAHPKMKQALAREAQAKQRIDAEVRKIVGGVESAYLAAKGREEELGRQLSSQRSKALEQKDVGADYSTLERDVGTARDLYANLLQRLKDVDVAEEIKVSNVVVVDRAAVPGKPSSPRKLLNLSIATLGGLMLGAAIAFLLEYFDNTLKTPDDVEQKLGLPSLGVIPSFDSRTVAYGSYGSAKRIGRGGASEGNLPAKRANGAGNELVVEHHPRSIVSEAYRAVRTAVLMSRSDTPPQIILFTSGAAGEGKTVTAVNQAITLAQSGGRVLIVDADIRKPRVHRVFRLENAQGLSTFLTGQSTLDAVIRRVAVNGSGSSKPSPQGNGTVAASEGSLHVISSGPLPPNPAELLGSKKMRDTLDGLREHYDYIVLDTPPVLPVTDAVLLSRACDGVVLVVRGQETPIEIVEKSRNRLRQVRAKILGVVLNDVDVTGGDYADYRRYSYAYYADSEAGDA